MAALAVAAGYSLAGVPNVELMTLIVFTSGWLTGAGGGAATGAVAMTVFTMANPYGAAVPLPAVAQISCMALAGGSGGLWARSERGRRLSPDPISMALMGAGVTLIYDLATNAAIGISFSQLVPTLAAGVPFALVHILANALIFALAGPYLIRGLALAGLRSIERAPS